MTDKQKLNRQLEELEDAYTDLTQGRGLVQSVSNGTYTFDDGHRAVGVEAAVQYAEILLRFARNTAK